MTPDNLPNDAAVLDRAYVFHPSTHLADYAAGELPTHIMSSGRGIHVKDRDGHEMIDGFAGLWCVNVGYGRREIAEAVRDQVEQLSYAHAYNGYSHDPVIRLSKRLADLAGMGMNHVFYGLSGSDAIRVRRRK